MKILLYNERNYAYNHTKLFSTPVEQEVAPVGISIPSGTFRLNYGGYFTHIKFNFDGVDWICRITARRSLGDTLHEYDYAIDYLKDYYNKYGFFDQDIVIERSTDSTLWKKFVVDNQFPRGNNYTQKFSTGSAQVPMMVMLVIDHFSNDNKDGCDAYFIDFDKWNYTQRSLLKPYADLIRLNDGNVDKSTYIKPEAVYNAIRGVYIVPKVSNNAYQRLELVNYISIFYKEGAFAGTDYSIREAHVKLIGGLDPSGDNIQSIYKLSHINTNAGISVEVPLDDSIIDPINDWRDIELKKYIAYAPLYGTFEIDPRTYDKAIYHISPSAGTISISLNDSNTSLLNSQRLPQISFMIDTSVSSQKILNAETAITIGSSVLPAVIGIGASAVTGGAAAPMALAGVAGSLTNTISQYAQKSYEISNQNITYSQSSGVFGTTIDTCRICKITLNQPLSMEEFASRNGLYCNYKIADTIPETTVNRRCWLNLNGARIKGERWYSANVINELNGECVMIDV